VVLKWFDESYAVNGDSQRNSGERGNKVIHRASLFFKRHAISRRKLFMAEQDHQEKNGSVNNLVTAVAVEQTINLDAAIHFSAVVA